MNWKVMFFQILFVWLITLAVSFWVLSDIHQTLNNIDKEMQTQIITDLQSKGWLPYEILIKEEE